MKRRVLVTGGSGFLGHYLLNSLSTDPELEIHVVGRQSPKQPIFWIFHQTDLFEEGKISKIISEISPTDLVSLAWCAGASDFRNDPANNDWLRVTQDLIKQFREQGGNHVTVAGSVEEYSLTTASLLEEEVTPIIPTSLYGQCKNGLRLWLDQYGRESGLSWAWGRVFWTFGEGEPERKYVAYIITRLLHNKEALLGPGTNKRDFLHAQEVGDGLALLAKKRVEGLYNIASGQAILLRDLAIKIALFLDRENLLRFRQQDNHQELSCLYADIRKLRQIGWKQQLSWQEALQQTITEYQNTAKFRTYE